MQNKKGLLGIVVALVAVIAIAALAYNALGQGQSMQQNIDLSSAGEAAQANEEASASSPSAGASSAGAESASAATGSNTADSPSSTAGTTMQLSDFSITALDGNEEVKLSSFYGKPTLLGFWATWCPPCNAEAPHLQKLYETYGDQVNFVMVDASVVDGRDTAESIQNWAANGGYTYPIYMDVTGSASIEAQIYYLPTMFVLDKEGNVLTAFSGALDEANGTQLIEQLLAL